MSIFVKKDKEGNVETDWKGDPAINIPVIVGAGIGVILLIWLILSSIAVVETGQVAVVTRFGNIVGFEGQGIHLKVPIDSYNIIDVTQQQVTAEYSTATKDNQSITQEITAQVAVNPENAEDLYQKFLGNHMDAIVDPILSDGFKSATAKFSLEDCITARDQLSEEMLKAVKERLAEYGINVVSVEVKNVNLPEEYKAAVERQKVAERDQVTAEVERQTAEINAETNRITAESLSDENFKQRFYEKWDGKLPTYMGGEEGLSMLLPSAE